LLREESKPGGDSFTATRPGIIATIYLSPNENQHENRSWFGLGGSSLLLRSERPAHSNTLSSVDASPAEGVCVVLAQGKSSAAFDGGRALRIAL